MKRKNENQHRDRSNAKSRSRHARITCKLSVKTSLCWRAVTWCRRTWCKYITLPCKESVACSFCAVWWKFTSGGATLITAERQYAFYYAKLLLLRGPKPSSCCVFDDCFGEKSSRPGESSTTFITDKLRRRVNACKRWVKSFLMF